MNLLSLIDEPRLRVGLIDGAEICASEDRKAYLLKGRLFSSASEPLFPPPKLAVYTEAFKTANAALKQGAALKDLRDQVINAGGAVLASQYMLLLQRLYQYRLLRLLLDNETGAALVLVPQREGHVPKLSREVPDPEDGLDRFACLRRSEGSWILESPLAGMRLYFRELRDLDSPLVRRLLKSEGFLESGQAESSARRDAVKMWEFHDLHFNWRTRLGSYSDPVGGMYPFVGEIEPLPAVRPKWPGKPVSFPTTSEEPASHPLSEVLKRRRSHRKYDESRVITLEQLGRLLDRAARIQGKSGYQIQNMMGKKEDLEFSSRPYPSGGASYELEIYPAVNRCDGLERGLYHYDSDAHDLVKVRECDKELDLVVHEAKVATGMNADPQIILAISARFGRVMWKYRSISYGVILRNVGALYQTLYLVATDLGISPCGLGTGNPSRFARMTGLDPLVEGTVGDFILGGPADDS